MTREKLIEQLKEISGKSQIYCDEEVEAMAMAIRLLSLAMSDPETGLMPCGCGRPAVYQSRDRINVKGEYEIMIAVKCPENHISTGIYFTKEEAKRIWNIAHGCKEDKT